jgi:photosystem II stability/assembly factor-like uncharacterized protein
LLRILPIFALSLITGWPVSAQERQESRPPDLWTTTDLSALRLRSIGPAMTSGRVVGFAVDPHNRGQYYVAAASGGVWKTADSGTTWTPVFDNEGSYSIGVVVLDPHDANVVWVGTGENNSQRSVGYGDGVYLSVDAGKTWKNVGLKRSEHVGRIAIDPGNSNVVYVAAQGPLWGPGGDRGLYKTTDRGKTWTKILNLSENTGVTDVVLDPRHPNVLIAASYQRRRHVWTLIDGGPESALYRSTDAGATWTKLTVGLPGGELGRIGLAVAPANPDVVYATIESTDRKGGIFRSTDRGVTWEKRNDYDQQAQYYAHLVVDPANADRIYVMGVVIQVSDDGGKTLHPLGERFKHVDNHEIWIDPRDPNFYRVGCDGGVYESSDRAAHWRFLGNLPITQFYDVAVDTAWPFYHIYGGTQDNFTLGGPGRNRSLNGITNQDWFVTQGGDGFHSRVDPEDPNTVYSEAQYGDLVRFDRRTGEAIGIQPQPGKGEPPFRWNWDSPLIISPHSHIRLYFAANKVFRSDDRGDTWTEISPDLTRQLDRNKLAVMGKVWSADAVAKNVSTSFYGNVVALSESPEKEGRLYAGTDDGLIQVTDDSGKHWRKIDRFPFVPERTYVSRILASQHDPDTVYACFDNHKNSDFAPYILRSTDAGKSWKSIRGSLPANGPVLALAEDHFDPNLLFVGTEFGLFFTPDGGNKWVRLRNGLPTIAVRDLAIQKQLNDLVVATFGRGFYVLDDYAPLRGLKERMLAEDTLRFPVRPAPLYIPERPYGLRGKAFQGDAFYTAENPPYGATFTYYLLDTIQTLKEKRHEREKELARKGRPIPFPSPAELRAEAEEEPPAILVSFAGADGQVIRTLTGPVSAGFHRVTWNLREPAPSLPRTLPPGRDQDLFFEVPSGPLVEPGTYRVTWARRVRGKVTPLPGVEEFTIYAAERADQDRRALAERFAFQQKVTGLQRAVEGTLEAANHLSSRLDQIKQALDQTPSINPKWKTVARELEHRNRDLLRALRGDEVLRARNENVPPSIVERVGYIVEASRLSLAKPTTTEREQYRIAGDEFAQVLSRLRRLTEMDVKRLDQALNQAGAPWTPGRLPDWKPEGRKLSK